LRFTCFDNFSNYVFYNFFTLLIIAQFIFLVQFFIEKMASLPEKIKSNKINII